MTGSGKNVDVAGILLGTPVYQDANGNILRAFGTSRPAFAIATTGTPVGGVVTYENDTEVERDSWLPIAGVRFLTPTQTYYLGTNGRIQPTGSQVIGVARSQTILRVSVQVSQTGTGTAIVNAATDAIAPAPVSLGDLEEKIALLTDRLDRLEMVPPVVIGVGPPTSTPDVPTQIHIGRPGNGVYYWNGSAWETLIAP